MCRGFLLPASHVIHTVGPIYDVDSNPAASLASAYRSKILNYQFDFSGIV
ncbi:O-acetyl-ADP-ribose deacetylase MACROD2 [Trifolium medium]|uniref:O-acetyl-ADP-ribose deacetylase MACROD2 n=1 Tax=Trifolium medium TaxID=97028 RepID=A0A392TRW6_9FABA|nr:O-acetyl-ADP-ribose deacetylase MACROD2 [Trifolium medium]